jgi:hypothetical protein
MKTFKNFYEDTGELRQQLGALDKEEGAKRKLEARRDAAKERIDRLSGSNDTEQRLASQHSADLERIRAIQAAKREKQRQKKDNSVSSNAVPNAVKAGAKIALKTGKNLVKRIKNRVNTNPQSSS